jgi:hypothetical protein
MSESTTTAERPERAPRDHADVSLEHAEIPRAERWLKVMYAAFLPAGAIAFVPSAWKLPLAGLTGALFLTGLVLLLAQERAKTKARR